ncbi:YdcF family protein [Curvivirga aplysinae]|uniref:YdcF family protein n=1 Tax=Curvivirga aplysinae TaxID=2529852 RepID=UPI001C3FBE4C|nr:YdcF family protein [Curvivirga aplysinae]
MFFYLSKIFYFLLNPINVFLILMLVSVIFAWMNWFKLARGLMTVIVTLALLITVFPIGTWGRIHLEQRFPPPAILPADVDGILVLGGAVNPALSAEYQQLILQSNIERLFAFAELIEHYPQAKAVYSGGSGSLFSQEYKEATLARDVLEKLHIPASKILIEDQSRNTYENIKLSKKLVKPEPGETWILVTSAAHMPRAIGIARHLDWKFIPFPVDYNFGKEMVISLQFQFYKGAGDLYSALYEFIGLLMYKLTDKTGELYPAPIRENDDKGTG